MAAIKSAAPAMATAFHTRNPVNGGYAVASDATRANVPEISDVAHVVRAGRVTRKGDAIPVLLVRDGSAARALEMSAVGAAIAGGVITVAEMFSLLRASGITETTLAAELKRSYV